MQRKTDRDESLERMLRTTRRADAPAATDDCLDAETIAAWTDGALPATAAARVETHLSTCPHCQTLLATLVRSTPPPAPTPSIWRRWHLRWLVPVAAAASALALWIAAPAREIPVPQRAALDDSRQFAQREPPGSPEVPQPPSEQPQNALEKKRSVGARKADRPDASSFADNAAAGAPAAARDRNAAAQSLQESAAPAPASPAPELERRELSARRQVDTIEAASPDQANRWRIVNRTRIERSTDSGMTWNVVPFPEALELTAIRAFSGTSAVVTLSDGRQFRTDDEGKTWTPLP